MFLIDRELADGIGGPQFDFQPYNYGPFDKDVYGCLEKLVNSGHIEIVSVPGKRYPIYKMTNKGQEFGNEKLDSLKSWVKDGIKVYNEWVRRVSFTGLISAIYKSYPDMKKNSVFNP